MNTKEKFILPFSDTQDFNGANAGDQNNSEGQFDESKLPNFKEIDPETATPEQVGAAVKAAQSLLGQMKHWKDKAIDPETKKPWADRFAETTKKKEEPSKPNTPSDNATDKRIANLEVAEEKRQFGHRYNLSPEETDKLFAYATGAGLKPADALKDPFFESGLNAFREATKNSQASLTPSHRRPTFEGKSFNELPDADKKKNFSSYTQGLINRKR